MLKTPPTLDKIFLKALTRTEADYLYIDAEGDHAALQFREKKGDLIKAENGGKNNGLAAKIVYVYEGKEKRPPKGGHRELVGCHYFCGTGIGESNDEFWDGIYRYLERNYDLEKVKKICLIFRIGRVGWPLSLFDMMDVSDPEMLACMDNYHVL